jgi:hypothetical protein
LRPLPRLIDDNSRLGEYLMVFMIPLFMLRSLDPVFGLLAAVVLCAAYVHGTLGRPQGYLSHRLYRMGLPLTGLLAPRLRRLAP